MTDTVLVTGAFGQVGERCVETLLSRGRTVIATDLRTETIAATRKLAISPSMVAFGNQSSWQYPARCYGTSPPPASATGSRIHRCRCSRSSVSRRAR